MSRKTPALTGEQLLRALQRHGFAVIRVVGSHHIMKHDDGRRTLIPVHSGETLKPGTLAGILRDVKIKREELLHHP
jgi:predicted RNA binding protein YcfA (HicA-like mRNA interferase family)